MFLGHIMNTKGIKTCSKKTKAVVKFQKPRTLKEVQSLNGKLASLNRFLTRFMEKSLPFFKTLKRCIKKSDLQWALEAEHAFPKMKQQIATLPMLSAPSQRPENFRRMEKWAVELQEHDISYSPRTSIKDQILADFIVERPGEDPSVTGVLMEEEAPEP
ncbi:hypothetical protein Tco_1256328 [Tanacetum coccineum]